MENKISKVPVVSVCGGVGSPGSYHGSRWLSLAVVCRSWYAKGRNGSAKNRGMPKRIS